MYVTRRLSEYQRNPLELERPPPDGPNSGVLVIQDEASKPTACFGLCYHNEPKGLPFPQNVNLTVDSSSYDSVLFIPALDQPLSSNRYYSIKRRGKHSGKALASAKEEDRVPCFFCFSFLPEAKPQEADPYDIYHQFEIHQQKSCSSRFFATSSAPNGKPPEFLQRKYWTVQYSNSQDFGLTDDAKGINTTLRSALPSDVNTSVVVGKWYVPFIFVKDRKAKDQIKSSTYYSMSLKQKWEEVYSCENVNSNEEEREVVVDFEVESEVMKLEGQAIEKTTKSVDRNGVVWYGIADKKIGLKAMVMERMKWEEERFGWSKKSNELRSSIKISERFEGGSSQWKSYKCYVLVESFELKRTDGSLVLMYEFTHADKLKSKWA
ncbi:PREDICTED: uncharacterized protein LOC104755636 [Camelina sativa]|uniref:Uncharacterized protein LOC104755636 n=1 Tax=Camelina sativa TaxID=90675 RepID=A0ABM0WUI0_CAMSA|nr:PREDICTED: uncharacterized protein LOC104755636 [Camelina sativa]